MQRLPLFLDVNDKPVLLAGGGEPALAKARLLSAAGARITVIAPDVSDDLRDIAVASGGDVQIRSVVEADLSGRRLLVAANEAEAEDRRLDAMGKAMALPVNVVDRPGLGTVQFGAIVDRGPVTIAIATGGAAPMLATRIRAEIERILPPGIGVLVQAAGSWRARVKERLTDGRQRRRFWDRLFSGAAVAAAGRGDLAAAEAEAERLLNEADRPVVGGVALVGAGPGDPELLTLKAHRLLREADVIIHDGLVSDAILDMARRDAERISVAKRKGRHSARQQDIEDLIITRAKAGDRVVRLKGGDPFIFGRGGEEVEALAAAGIDAEIVPGITAATGCAAATGIPLTHRDHASAVTFITAHETDGPVAEDRDWSSVAGPNRTLVIYMGATQAREIGTRLQRRGLSPETPVAVVENGTRADQRLVRADLSTLHEKVAEAGLKGPALIIIGAVAARATPQSLAPAETALERLALAG